MLSLAPKRWRDKRHFAALSVIMSGANFLFSSLSEMRRESHAGNDMRCSLIITGSRQNHTGSILLLILTKNMQG